MRILSWILGYVCYLVHYVVISVPIDDQAVCILSNKFKLINISLNESMVKDSTLNHFRFWILSFFNVTIHIILFIFSCLKCWLHVKYFKCFIGKVVRPSEHVATKYKQIRFYSLSFRNTKHCCLNAFPRKLKKKKQEKIVKYYFSDDSCEFHPNEMRNGGKNIQYKKPLLNL